MFSVVTGAIFDHGDRLFVQQRSLTRRLFPGCWEMPGGHVEPEEEVEGALLRELEEETGWSGLRVGPLIFGSRWVDDAGREHSEGVFLVRSNTRLAEPRVEQTKVMNWCWLDNPNAEWLGAYREPTDDSVRRAITAAFAHRRLQRRKQGEQRV